MTLTDEELDALAGRISRAHFEGWRTPDEQWRAAAREAARWAEERQGEVMWEVWQESRRRWVRRPAEDAQDAEARGLRVRAIRVIATTTKGVW